MNYIIMTSSVRNVCMRQELNGTVEPLFDQDTNGAEDVSLLVRCPHFRG